MDPSLFQTQFTLLDWVIVAIYLIAVGVVGVWVNTYINNVSDYMIGGASTGLALNTASYIGTELGLVTIMYASIEAFTRGFSYIMIPLLALIAGLFLGKTGFVISRLREMKLVTIPEYYEQRFGKNIRVISATLMALAGILNMGLFPKMGATFITYATGLAATPEAETLVNIVMTLLIILVVVYTVFGGMVAVIVTDYLQFVILSISLLLGLVWMLASDGLGWGNLVETIASSKGIAGFNPVHTDSYGWSYIIWMLVVYMTVGFTWGPSASRALTAENPKVARQTHLLASPGQFIRLAIPAMFAFGAFTWFAGQEDFSSYFFPDGITATAAHTAVAMPLFLGKLLPTGLLGIVVAGLLAAFMSTHDSYFLSWASVISRDIISPFRKKKPTDQQEIRFARIAVIAIGVFLMVWGLWYKLPDSVWTYMAITGNIYLTGATATMIGGLYWKKASKAGALAALLGGLVSLVGIFPETLQHIAPWLTIGVLGLSNYVLCMVLMVVFSLWFPDNPANKN